MIDRKTFEENFRGIDAAVIISIINIFEEEFPQRFKEIHRNILEEDFAKLAFNAHSLKGVVSTFWAEVPARLAKELEIMARDEQPQGMIPLFEELKSASEILLGELKIIREELSQNEI